MITFLRNKGGILHRRNSQVDIWSFFSEFHGKQTSVVFIDPSCKPL